MSSRGPCKISYYKKTDSDRVLQVSSTEYTAFVCSHTLSDPRRQTGSYKFHPQTQSLFFVRFCVHLVEGWYAVYKNVIINL